MAQPRVCTCEDDECAGTCAGSRPVDELRPGLRAFVEQMQTALQAQTGDDFERLAEHLLDVQVCTSLSDEDAVVRMNLTPAGTTHGWQLATEPNLAPVPCAEKPTTHRHLIFEC